jgi:hypothetical protein
MYILPMFLSFNMWSSNGLRYLKTYVQTYCSMVYGQGSCNKAVIYSV